MREITATSSAPPRTLAVWVFLAALAVNAALAVFITLPGYMDAYYYFGGAERLARGFGFTEPYLWNYLDNPARLPHPSHLYWMPLPSMIAALPMWLCGALCPDNAALFRAAQIPNVLLAALLPVLAFRLAWRAGQPGQASEDATLEVKDRDKGGAAGSKRLTGHSPLRPVVPAYSAAPIPPSLLPWLALSAAWFALFAGFYSIFWANTDSFTPYAVVGSLALVCAGIAAERNSLLWFGLAGGLAGLAHLTRADGILLLGVAGWYAVRQWRSTSTFDVTLRAEGPATGGVGGPKSLASKAKSSNPPSARPFGATPLRVTFREALKRQWQSLAPAVAVVAGYLVVMLPWLIRNVVVSGSPLAPGGTQALWFTSYNDLFNFPAAQTLDTYLAAGWGAVLAGKWEAVSLNVQTAIAVQGWVVLTPFICVGLWRLWRQTFFRPAIFYAALLWLVMTFVFTFPGPRGGLFHSGTALLPFFAAAGPVGLVYVVRWVAHRRPGWRVATATRVFLAGLAAITTIVTLSLFWGRVIGGNLANPAWSQSDAVYVEIGNWLDEAGEGQSVVVVNNPPGYYYHAAQPAVVVPNGDVDTLLAVAERYGAPWVILDANVPAGLQSLYDGDEQVARLRLAHTFADHLGRPVYLFEVALP